MFLILAAIFVGQGLGALIFLVPFGILSVGYYFWPVRAASKESYAYRYWNGLPYVGEYAIMRGYLFLRIKPRLAYTYLKPRRLEQLGNGVLIVRGSKWLRQRYELYLRDNEERSVLVQKLISIGAREEGTQNQVSSRVTHNETPPFDSTISGAALAGQTPAERARVGVEDEDKWLGLSQKALRQKNSGE